MSDGNPYARMVSVMRGESGERTATGESDSAGLGAGPAKLRLGTVVQRAPLEITVAGVRQPTEALRINERLTKGARWKAKIASPNSDFGQLSGPISGPVSTPLGTGALISLDSGEVHSGNATIDEATVEQLEIDLEVGDMVLLLTEDDQIFYIIMKVVGAV